VPGHPCHATPRPTESFPSPIPVRSPGPEIEKRDFAVLLILRQNSRMAVACTPAAKRCRIQRAFCPACGRPAAERARRDAQARHGPLRRRGQLRRHTRTPSTRRRPAAVLRRCLLCHGPRDPTCRVSYPVEKYSSATVDHCRLGVPYRATRKYALAFRSRAGPLMGSLPYPNACNAVPRTGDRLIRYRHQQS